MNKHIYIETNIEINSIVALSQHIINDRIITLIGEIHDHNFKCKNKTISLNKYIENRLKTNDKSAVFLEFNKDTDKIKDLGSFNLKNIVKSLKKNNIHIPTKKCENNKRIKSSDHRDYFFNSYNLYADDNYFLKLNKNKIIKEFIEPYFKTKERLIEKGDYISELIKYKTHNILIDQKIFNYLKNVYIPSIEDNFINIYNYIKTDKLNKTNKLYLLDEIRKVWAKIADFYIIIEIFNLNCKYNEIIILFGNMHYLNFQEIFKNFRIKPVVNQENFDTDPNKCVKKNIFIPSFL